jgi:hypothetical protein
MHQSFPLGESEKFDNFFLCSGLFPGTDVKILKILRQNFDHNIGFREKRHFLAENWRKSQKIVIITSTPDHFHFPGDFDLPECSESGNEGDQLIGDAGFQVSGCCSKRTGLCNRIKVDLGNAEKYSCFCFC